MAIPSHLTDTGFQHIQLRAELIHQHERL